MSKEPTIRDHEHAITIPEEITLQPYQPVALDPSLPLREEHGYSVIADIVTNRTSMDEPRADSFAVVDLESAPGDEHGNKWFQGEKIHSSVRFLLVDADLNKVDMQRNRGFKGIREGETVYLGRADETAVSRFNPSEYVSRNHFSISLSEDGELSIQDNGSSNGTRIRVASLAQESSNENGVDRSDNHGEKRNQLVEVGEVILGNKNPCEDTLLTDEQHNVYGVFDGAGGHAEGDRASKTAARVTREQLSRLTEDSRPEEILHAIEDALIEANKSVKKGTNGGVTTGTVVKIKEENGQKFAIWASVGDSPIMIFNRNTATLTRVSKDEILSPSRANVITNALGSQTMNVRQSGIISLQQGDEILMCSDGITGDFAPDILEDREIIAAMQSATNPHDIARALLGISRKIDDKAVLVLK